MISFEPVDSLAAAEVLRVLRNECAGSMTRDTSQITAAAQREFFAQKIATGKIEGFLMFSGAEPVAYGLLVWDEQHCVWSSTGVKTSRRFEGFGRAVTVENARRAHAKDVPIWAEVRADNKGQQKICRTVGYQMVRSITRDGVDIDVLRCDKLKPEYA